MKANKNKRLKIRDECIVVHLLDLLDGKTLSEGIEALTNAANGNDPSAIKFNVSYGCYDERDEVHLEIWRDETDQEFKLRTDKEAAKKAKSLIKSTQAAARAKAKLQALEDTERAEYQRLKEKFGA